MGLFDFLKKKPPASAASPQPPLSREKRVKRVKCEQVLADIFGAMNFEAVEEASKVHTGKIIAILRKEESLTDHDLHMLNGFSSGLIKQTKDFPPKAILDRNAAKKLIEAINQEKFYPPTMDLEVLVAADEVELVKKILGTVFTATPDTSSLRDIDLTHDGTAPPPPSTSTKLTYAVTQKEVDDLRGMIAGNETHLAPNDPDLAPFIHVALTSRKEAETSKRGENSYSWHHPTADLLKALDLDPKPKPPARRQLPPGDEPKRTR